MEPIPCPRCDGFGKNYFEYSLPENHQKSLKELMKLDPAIQEMKLSYCVPCFVCKGTGMSYQSIIQERVTH